TPPVAGEDLMRLIPSLAVLFSSQYPARLVVTPASLTEAVSEPTLHLEGAEFADALRSAVDAGAPAAASADALRRAHHKVALQIVLHDMKQAARSLPEGWPALRSSNLAQTALAEAVLDVASDLTLWSMGNPRARAEALPLAVIGLGRLGHAGMDHGSDLDLI